MTGDGREEKEKTGDSHLGAGAVPDPPVLGVHRAGHYFPVLLRMPIKNEV